MYSWTAWTQALDTSTSFSIMAAAQSIPEKAPDVTAITVFMVKSLWVRERERYLMFYAQSTVQGHIGAKQNIFLPQAKFWFIVYDISLFMVREVWKKKKVEWTRKAKARQEPWSPGSRHSMQRYILTYSRLRKREDMSGKMSWNK